MSSIIKRRIDLIEPSVAWTYKLWISRLDVLEVLYTLNIILLFYTKSLHYHTGAYHNYEEIRTSSDKSRISLNAAMFKSIIMQTYLPLSPGDRMMC
jgi:hypothetical protein